MASRSATVLVIFVIAVIAFCLASVFGAMTGTISILPNESNTGGVLDNLSAITDGTGDTGISYGNEHSDYSSSSGSDVETTTDSSSSSSDSGQVETTTDNPSQQDGGSTSNGGDSSSNSKSNVEITRG